VTLRVGINGFGRIGRNVMRAAKEAGADIDFVAVNDLGVPETMAHLLKYDSVYGNASFDVAVEDDGFLIDGDSTKFAKKVIISAPSGDPDAMLVLGVNDEELEASHDIVSNASCTTNCFAPMAKILDDAFGVEQGLITTIHAYTGTQNLVDAPHKDLRRSRAAAVNLIPTSTGAAKATGRVLDHLMGKLDGMAMRVPVPAGSATDFVGTMSRDVTVDEVNEAFRAAAAGPMAGIVAYSDEALVSSDIVGRPESCIFDSGMTMTMGTMVKIIGWYDNEWGYSNRMVDLALKLGELMEQE